MKNSKKRESMKLLKVADQKGDGCCAHTHKKEEAAQQKDNSNQQAINPSQIVKVSQLLPPIN